MRKSDAALLKNLKKQEQKQKEQAIKEQEQIAAADQITFDLWWNDISKVLKLPAYMKEIVWADFKSRGLKKDDTLTRYTEAAKKFGLI